MYVLYTPLLKQYNYGFTIKPGSSRVFAYSKDQLMLF